MINKEIIQNIIDNNAIDEIYEILRQMREETFKAVVKKNAENKATLRIIKKLSKEKVVRDILCED